MRGTGGTLDLDDFLNGTAVEVGQAEVAIEAQALGESLVRGGIEWAWHDCSAILTR
jgi:hypothetical protein